MNIGMQWFIRHSRESAGLSGEFAMSTGPKAQRPLCNSEASWPDLIIDLIRLSTSSQQALAAPATAWMRGSRPAHDDLQLVPIKIQQPIPVPLA
jgi:hypothetical protein